VSDLRDAVSQLFTTPFMAISHPEQERLMPGLVRAIKDGDREVDNRQPQKSETAPTFHRRNEPEVEELVDWVLQAAEEYVVACTGMTVAAAWNANRDETIERYNLKSTASEPVGDASLIIGRCWGMRYKDGGAHGTHLHPNTAIVANYYVDAGDGSGGQLSLVDPRAGVDCYDSGIRLAGEGTETHISVENGMLVIFPGWLSHSVTSYHGTAERLAISFNIGVLAPSL
jgi:Putative 2OG-Fe(II) oxygenase